MLYVFCFCCNESIVVNDIKNVHNVSFLFIRNSIGYFIIVKDLRKILSRYKTLQSESTMEKQIVVFLKLFIHPVGL